MKRVVLLILLTLLSANLYSQIIYGEYTDQDLDRAEKLALENLSRSIYTLSIYEYRYTIANNKENESVNIVNKFFKINYPYIKTDVTKVFKGYKVIKSLDFQYFKTFLNSINNQCLAYYNLAEKYKTTDIYSSYNYYIITYAYMERYSILEAFYPRFTDIKTKSFNSIRDYTENIKYKYTIYNFDNIILSASYYDKNVNIKHLSSKFMSISPNRSLTYTGLIEVMLLNHKLYYNYKHSGFFISEEEIELINNCKLNLKKFNTSYPEKEFTDQDIYNEHIRMPSDNNSPMMFMVGIALIALVGGILNK